MLEYRSLSAIGVILQLVCSVVHRKLDSNHHTVLPPVFPAAQVSGRQVQGYTLIAFVHATVEAIQASSPGQNPDLWTTAKAEVLQGIPDKQQGSSIEMQERAQWMSQ